MRQDTLARRLANRVARHPVLRTLRDEARASARPLWIVGGYVRDAALGKPAGDFDLVTAGGTRAWRRWIVERYATEGFRFRKRGVTTWRFSLGGDPVDWVDADRRGLDADLRRRDFTVNAMAFELASIRVADPLGGLADLRNRRLRLCFPNTLREDPVRVLRLARFAAQLEFSVCRQADAAARDAVGQLTAAAVERTAGEFDRLLRCRRPLLGLRPAYRWGAVDRLLPELVPMRTCVAGKERPDVETHTLLALEHAPNLARRRLPFAERLADPDVRRILHWALWLHDIAKPDTLAELPGGRPSFHGHEELGSRMADRLLRRLKFGGNSRERIVRLIRLHLRPGHLADAGASPRALRRLVRDAGEDLPLLVLHAAADALGSGATGGQARWRRLRIVLGKLERTASGLRHVRRKPWLTGTEVMRTLGIPAGPAVGRTLEAMIDAQQSGEIDSARAARAWLARRATESAPE